MTLNIKNTIGKANGKGKGYLAWTPYAHKMRYTKLIA